MRERKRERQRERERKRERERGREREWERKRVRDTDSEGQTDIISMETQFNRCCRIIQCGVLLIYHLPTVPFFLQVDLSYYLYLSWDLDQYLGSKCGDSNDSPNN